MPVLRVMACVPLLLATGCATAGPTYVLPEITPPPAWTASALGGVSTSTPDPSVLSTWWTVLNDPMLTELVDTAIGANLDVRRAQVRVTEARARRGGVSADRLPLVTGDAAATTTSAGDGVDRDVYNLGTDASWELDLFGGRRRALEAATADIQASVEELGDVLVSLASEVTLAYVELRLAQQRIITANANLQTQSETYDITRWRFEAGLTTELDVEQARSNLEQTRAQLPGLRATQEQAAYRIAVLLGEAPGRRQQELTAFGSIPVPPVDIAAGVPAEVLRRRPDIRRAERQLAAQVARVGVATADKFPQFTLSGSIGLEALSLGDLFSTAARALIAGINVGQTIFDAGRIRQNIQVQNAVAEQALLAYEAAVLAALEEVENALVAFTEQQARRASLVDASDAARRTAALADERYRSGLIDFQIVLDAQRSLLALEDQLAISSATVTSNLVRLYKALGGGWTASPGATP